MSDDMPRPVSVTDDEILAEFSNSRGPVDTAPDLAERLPIKQDAIRKRLKRLEEGGRVCSRQGGSRAVVWYLPEN